MLGIQGLCTGKRGSNTIICLCKRQTRGRAAPSSPVWLAGRSSGLIRAQGLATRELNSLLSHHESCCPRPPTGTVLLGATPEALAALAEADGQPAYRGKQLADGVRNGARSIADIAQVWHPLTQQRISWKGRQARPSWLPLQLHSQGVNVASVSSAGAQQLGELICKVGMTLLPMRRHQQHVRSSLKLPTGNCRFDRPHAHVSAA